jgi:hypothetical protein
MSHPDEDDNKNPHVRGCRECSSTASWCNSCRGVGRYRRALPVSLRGATCADVNTLVNRVGETNVPGSMAYVVLADPSKRLATCQLARYTLWRHCKRDIQLRTRPTSPDHPWQRMGVCPSRMPLTPITCIVSKAQCKARQHIRPDKVAG